MNDVALKQMCLTKNMEVMYMFSNIFFTMSLTGSIVFLLYILTYPFAKKYFSLKWRYMILKMAIVFYLLPVSMCKYLIIDVIHRFFPRVVGEKQTYTRNCGYEIHNYDRPRLCGIFVSRQAHAVSCAFYRNYFVCHNSKENYPVLEMENSLRHGF